MRGLLVVALFSGILALTACGAEPSPVPTEVPPTKAAPATRSLPTDVPPSPTPPPTNTPADALFESPLPIPTGAVTDEPFESPLGLPNPASKFCEDQGHRLEMRTDASGTAGYCIFPDGSECEEWAYYRGECGPPTPTP